MAQPGEFEIARYKSLVLTHQGIRQVSGEDGVRVNAFIPTHAIAGYEETSSQKLGLLFWALVLFAIAVGAKDDPVEWGRIASLPVITQILRDPKTILDFLPAVGVLGAVYLVYRFFKTRSHAIRIHSTSGFSVVEVNKEFFFFPRPTDFLTKLEAEISAAGPR